VGAGEHRQLQAKPYIFSRALETEGIADRVIVATEQGAGAKTIPVFGVFADGTELMDAYSGQTGTVRNGAVALTTASGLVLLAPRQ
jgi:alpha-amylase